MNCGDVRDQFLRALDAKDRAASLRLASFLTGSTNVLPSVVCEELGLPKGSSYARAACWVLASGAAGLPLHDRRDERTGGRE
jgi:hypothetical protein